MDLLKPSKMIKILKEIQQQVPNDMSLKIPMIRSEVISYYKHIQTLVVPDQGQFSVVFAILVVLKGLSLNVFHAIVVPVPQNNSSISANYKLETTFLAVSGDTYLYTLLEKEELIRCFSSPYCKLRLPLYKTANYPTCIMALYTQNSELSHEICSTEVSKSPQLPIPIHVYENHWVIITTTPFMLSIVCERRSNRVENHEISKGLHHIELQTRCSGQCKYFELPKYVKGNSEVTKRNAFENYFNLSHLSPNIWLHPELATLSDHIGIGSQNNTLYLQHLNNIPTKQLLSDLSLSEKATKTARVNQYSEMNTYDVITFSCLGIGALCTIILFFFWLHKSLTLANVRNLVF